MIRITSLVLLATSLVAFSSPLLPRTAAQIETDLNTLITDTQTLDTNILKLPTEGILVAGTLEEATTALLSQLQTSITDATNTGQLDETDGTTVLGLVTNLKPVILKTLGDLDDNKAEVVTINGELSGFLAFVQEELSSLATSTESYANELIDIAPADLKPSASAIATTINAAFASAIAVYAA